jgi:tetratricopeptide (TPR) repeat protein
MSAEMSPYTENTESRLVSKQDKFDFFISRSGKDKDIAILIASILRGAGYTTFVQDEDFGHASFMAMMAKGWSDCVRLICVLSDSYQKSEYCRKEYEVALAPDPRNLHQRVIVLRIDGTDPIEHLADLPYTDLVPMLSDVTAFACTVRGAVGATKDRAEIDFAALYRRAPKQIIHHNIEYNSNFIGREEDLARLDAVFASGLTAALTNSGSAAAVSGLGGIGKSVLAREYAWRNRSRYQGEWWIRAGRPETLLEDLVELGGHFIPGLRTTDDRPKAVRATLDHIWQGEYALPWLLVYDNVEKPGDIEHLTPRGGAHVLITTRWPHWDDAAEVTIDVFSKEVAVEYLMKRARKKDPNGAARLAEALGYLPLALDQASSFCIDGYCTFDSYRAQLADFLKKKPRKGNSKGQYPDSIYATFNLALDNVINGNAERGIAAIPEAEQLLKVFAFLAPDRIPMDLIRSDVLTDIQKSEAATALQEAALIRIGTYEDGSPHASVHRLVQQVMRGRLEAKGELEDAARETMRLISSEFEIGSSTDELKRTERLAPHAICALQHAPADIFMSPFDGAKNRTLVDAIGDWLVSRGDPKGALACYKRTLNIRERYIAAHPNDSNLQELVCISLRRVARVKRILGDREGILALYERSLGICERLAESDPKNSRWQYALSVSLNDMAGMKLAAGNRGAALALYERSLGICERLAEFDPKSTDWQISLSSSLDNIARVKLSAGDREGALAFYERSLNICERLAETDPQEENWQIALSASLDNIADVKIVGLDVDAIPYLQRSLAIDERIANADPGNWQRQRAVAITHKKIASALMTTDSTASQRHALKTIQIMEKFAELDKDNFLAKSEIADSHVLLGIAADSQQHFAKALDILESLRLLQPGNIQINRQIALCYAKVALWHLTRGEKEAAFANFDRSKMFGEEASNSDAADIFTQIMLLISLGDFADGLLKYADIASAIAVRRKCFDLANRLLKIDLNNTAYRQFFSLYALDLAKVLSRRGEHLEAATFCEHALANDEQLAGSDPKNTKLQVDLSATLDEVADMKLSAGDSAGALALYERSLDICERLAESDPKNTRGQIAVSASLDNIADMKLSAGDSAGALALYERSLDICEKLAESDPKNIEFLRYVSNALIKLGDTKLRAMAPCDAITLFERSLDICERVAEFDPENLKYQWHISFSSNRVAEALVATRDIKRARIYYERSFVIRDRQAKLDPTEPDGQHRVAFSLGRLADMEMADGNSAEALVKYQTAREIYKKLAAVDEFLPEWQQRLATMTFYIVRAELFAIAGPSAELLHAYRELFKLDRMSSLKTTQEEILLTSRIFSLAPATEAYCSQLADVLNVLRRLDSTGHLNASEKSNIPIIEAAIVASQKKTRGGFIARLLSPKARQGDDFRVNRPSSDSVTDHR